MPAFAVLEPPGHGDTAIAQADRFIFLREKFSFGAFLLGPLWLIGHRLWLELVVYLAGLAVIGAGLYALDVGLPASLRNPGGRRPFPALLRFSSFLGAAALGSARCR